MLPKNSNQEKNILRLSPTMSPGEVIRLFTEFNTRTFEIQKTATDFRIVQKLKFTVLVFDNDRKKWRGLQKKLSNYRFTVIDITDQPQVLFRMIQKNEPHIVLFNGSMPDIDIIETMKTATAIPTINHVHFHMISKFLDPIAMSKLSALGIKRHFPIKNADRFCQELHQYYETEMEEFFRTSESENTVR